MPPIVRSPLFDFFRHCARIVGHTATSRGNSAVPATGAAPPASIFNRRQFHALCGAGVAAGAVPTLLGGCHVDPFVVLHRGPEILVMRGNGGVASDDFQRRVMAAYARLPTTTKQILRDHHYRIYLSPTVREHRPKAAANIIGTHKPRHIIVAEYFVVDGAQHRKEDPGGVLRHEVGHALDWHFRGHQDWDDDRLSASAPFYATLEDDMRSHNEAVRREVRRLLHAHGYSGGKIDPYAGDSYSWDDRHYRNAEVFAILFDQLVAGNMAEPLFRYLPRTTEYVRFHTLQRPALEGAGHLTQLSAGHLTLPRIGNFIGEFVEIAGGAGKVGV